MCSEIRVKIVQLPCLAVRYCPQLCFSSAALSCAQVSIPSCEGATRWRKIGKPFQHGTQEESPLRLPDPCDSGPPNSTCQACDKNAGTQAERAHFCSSGSEARFWDLGRWRTKKTLKTRNWIGNQEPARSARSYHSSFLALTTSWNCEPI